MKESEKKRNIREGKDRKEWKNEKEEDTIQQNPPLDTNLKKKLISLTWLF